MNTAVFYDGPNRAHDEIVAKIDIDTMYVDCNPDCRFLIVDHVLPKTIKFGFVKKKRLFTLPDIQKLGEKLQRRGISGYTLKAVLSPWCTTSFGQVRISAANPRYYGIIYTELQKLLK